ncbi:hypothetical protein ACU686_41755 [Yinghuangia aomiensis]
MDVAGRRRGAGRQTRRACPGWQADATGTKWAAPPPPPPAMGWQLYGVRANRGLGIAVGVLLGINVLLSVLNAMARWRTAEAADDLLRGSGDGRFPGSPSGTWRR